VASSHEKDVETMPTQKLFKQRIRTRMAKTGESYTAARRQLLHKAGEAEAIEPAAIEPAATQAAVDADLLTSDASMRRGSGRGHGEWFAMLDAWGATGHTHTEIARWLNETQGVPSWWSQNITVNYERARGMRSAGQMVDGFSISVTRTVAVEQEPLFAAITNATTRKRWLPGVTLRSRPTRAAWTARFDWADPPSRIVFTVIPKSPGKALIAVGHEKLPDAEAAARLKTAWRGWLGDLKALLEAG
jgi:uncharacterized protein YndB with AHSA1/START domain